MRARLSALEDELRRVRSVHRASQRSTYFVSFVAVLLSSLAALTALYTSAREEHLKSAYLERFAVDDAAGEQRCLSFGVRCHAGQAQIRTVSLRRAAGPTHIVEIISEEGSTTAQSADFFKYLLHTDTHPEWVQGHLFASSRNELTSSLLNSDVDSQRRLFTLRPERKLSAQPESVSDAAELLLWAFSAEWWSRLLQHYDTAVVEYQCRYTGATQTAEFALPTFDSVDELWSELQSYFDKDAAVRFINLAAHLQNAADSSKHKRLDLLALYADAYWTANSTISQRRVHRIPPSVDIFFNELMQQYDAEWWTHFENYYRQAH